MPELSDALRAARRALDGMACVRDLSSWMLVATGTKRWALRFVVDTALEPTEFVPNPSTWFVVVDDAYPLGSIEVFPAAEGGINATFPHMGRNEPSRSPLPFRTGKLCVTTPDAVFARFGTATEPYNKYARLAWHVGRTVEWVKAAANDELLRYGDPYEFPVFPASDTSRKTKKWSRVAFQENSERLAQWGQRGEEWGLVPLHPVAKRLDIRAVGDFENGDGHTVMPVFWGRAVDRLRSQWAAWLRLPAPPVIAPWAAPKTWGELFAICRHMGVDCDTFVSQLSRWARRETIHHLLVGFPVPELVGGEDVQMAWKAVRFEQPLSQKMQIVAGYRGGPKQLQMQLRLMLNGGNPLNWQPTENWDTQVLNARGAFDRRLCTTRILAIGVGAVGSKVAETLARGGCENLTLADSDVLSAGNLRRHTLLLTNVDRHKVGGLSNRLNQISPYMTAVGFSADLPPAGEGLARLIRKAELVLDMTAEDPVLAALATYADSEQRAYVSISTGRDARRLFFYAHKGERFPLDDFHTAIEPWLERETVDRQAQGATMGVPDAPGCWHPLFPARDDSLQILAGAAVRMIERFYTGELTAGLHVLELTDDPRTWLPTLAVATL